MTCLFTSSLHIAKFRDGISENVGNMENFHHRSVCQTRSFPCCGQRTKARTGLVILLSVHKTVAERRKAHARFDPRLFPIRAFSGSIGRSGDARQFAMFRNGLASRVKFYSPSLFATLNPGLCERTLSLCEPHWRGVTSLRRPIADCTRFCFQWWKRELLRHLRHLAPESLNCTSRNLYVLNMSVKRVYFDGWNTSGKLFTRTATPSVRSMNDRSQSWNSRRVPRSSDAGRPRAAELHYCHVSPRQSRLWKKMRTS